MITGAVDSPRSAYEPLRVIMDAQGATCTPEQFYWAVNEAFHSAEASLYDKEHAGMFLGGEPMWRRLLTSVEGRRLEVLDVGCGTGLVGEFLFRIAPEAIERITLLDPSPAMLEQSAQRSRNWPLPATAVELVQGDISAVEDRTFDLVTVSSVFHHVVEIEKFCSTLARIIRPNGFLFQMQDPRADIRGDQVLAGRQEAMRARRKPSPYGRARRFAGAILDALGRPRKSDPIEAGTNAQLLERGVIARPLPLQSIWAVTDFHVPGQPGAFGHGFGVSQLTAWLAPLQLVDYFTYEFHGAAWDQLTPAEKLEDAEWWTAGDEHGSLFGSSWKQP